MMIYVLGKYGILCIYIYTYGYMGKYNDKYNDKS